MSHKFMKFSPTKLAARNFDKRIARIHRQMYYRCLFPIFVLVFIFLAYSFHCGAESNEMFHNSISFGFLEKIMGSKSTGSSNAVLKSKMLATDNIKFQKTAPVFGFVFFNGYRMSKFGFAAVGIGGLRLRDTRKMDQCYFLSSVPKSNPVMGRVSVYYPGEHHDLTYETIVAQCMFPDDSGSDMAGSVYLMVDGEEILIHREKDGSTPAEDPKGPFKHQVTFCSPPIYGSVETIRIYEWIEYHIRIGVEHLIMYDAGGIDGELADVLAPYVRKGIMEVVNTTETLLYDTWLYTQVALMNDCAYRTRYTSRWSMFMDFDEYWIANQLNLKLGNLLDSYDGKSFITFGSLWWSVNHCEPNLGEGEWPVERMHYHWPKIYCQHLEKYKDPNLCLDYYGHRKYAVDPRLVTALQIHRPEIPGENGIDLTADVARMNHFQGLIRKNGTLCKNLVGPGEKVEWWVPGDNIASVSRRARVGKPYVSMEDAKLLKTAEAM